MSPVNRSAKRRAVVTAIVFAVCLFPSVSYSQSLAEIYKSGKVKFVPEMTITDESMSGKDFFGSPLMGVVLDDKGIIYVCDYKANNLKKFDAAGKYLGTIGKTGQGPGDFNGPAELVFSKGRLYVREGMNMRVSILNLDGSLIKSVPIDFQKGYWQIMRPLPDGRIVLQKQLTRREDLNAPQEIILELYSADLEFIKTIYQRQVRLDKYVAEPRYVNIPIAFAPSVYWDITSDGKIVLGYSEKYEIEFYDPDKGKISTFSHTYTPVEIAEPDQEQFFQRITVATTTDRGERSIKRGAPDYMVKNTEFPKVFPPFHGLKVDSQNNIWVILWTSLVQKTRGVFDAFEPSGKFINRVLIENDEYAPSRPFWLPNGFWCIKANSDEEYRAVKYRIKGLN
jgi:hypothetical protein